MANNYKLIVEVENLNLKDLNELSRKISEWEQSTVMAKHTTVSYTYIDPVGGSHSDGCGISPFGEQCGECCYITCEDCSKYRQNKKEGKKRT